jgi:hypothetical protein
LNKAQRLMKMTAMAMLMRILALFIKFVDG